MRHKEVSSLVGLKFRHLLDVTVANTSYIFDLDNRDKNQEAIQIDLLESTDQLHNLETFINTGTSLTSVVKKSDKEKDVDEKDWPLI